MRHTSSGRSTEWRRRRLQRRASRKAERLYRFQKKVHEEQATFKDSLGDHLIEAESQLLRAARLLDKGSAKQALEKAKQSLAQARSVGCKNIDSAWESEGSHVARAGKGGPRDIAISGKADSTAKKYAGTFQRCMEAIDGGKAGGPEFGRRIMSFST